MSQASTTRAAPLVLVLLPGAAVFFARLAAHSDLAASYPRAAALIFLWIAADSTLLAMIARAEHRRVPMRAVLGVLAGGGLVVTLGSPAPVREAWFEMREVLIALGLTALVWLGWSLSIVVRAYRHTRSAADALTTILPLALVRFVAFELGMMRLALFSWNARPDVPEGGSAHGYHRFLVPQLWVLFGLQVVELAAVHFLIAHWAPRVALVLGLAGVGGILWTMALIKSLRLNPIVLNRTHLRLRMGPLIDRTLPLDLIAAIAPHVDGDAVRAKTTLNVAVFQWPNLMLELTEPMTIDAPFGRSRQIERVALKLDDPAAFLAALAEAKGPGTERGGVFALQ